jgi:ABC-2 type transport system ATP-binding protein
MSDERTPSSDPRPGVSRKRVRARPTSRRPGAGSESGTRAPSGTSERPVRPWEVDSLARETARERARVDPATLLRDVPEDAVIVARNLTKKYGDFTAVDSLDLTIHAGEVFGLLGPNGAGKTTTVLMLLGLSEPTSGVARVLGLDPTRQPLAVKRRVGYLPDDVGFYPGMTGRENLRYTARLNGIARRESEERVAELLHEVRLEEAADNPVETYSRGMRQRLGIADALVKTPSVLVLDEPTIAIDPAGVEELLALIHRLVREHRLTVLLSSHILGQVQSLCDRVGFFWRGRLIASGPLHELARRAGTERIVIEVGVEGESEVIDPIASAVPGVSGVEAHPHDPRLRIVTATQDVAAALTVGLSAAGHPVTHLRRQGDDLAELYRQLVPEATDDRPR